MRTSTNGAGEFAAGGDGEGGKAQDYGLLAGVALAVAAALVLTMTLFWAPVIGAVDFGELHEQLPELGLQHTQAENAQAHFYTYVVERYDWAHFSYMKLLAPSGTPSIAYPIAAVRFIAKPLGLAFSTRYLAACYILAISFSMYCIGRYGYRWLRGGIFVPALLALLLFSASGLTAYLNSLYGAGMTLCAAFLFAGFLLRACARRGWSSLLGLMASGFLLTTSQPELIVFLPLVWVVVGVTAWRNRPGRLHLPIYALVVATALVGCTYSSALRFLSSKELNSDVATYQALFHGVFKYAPDPVAAMGDFGLDEGYSPDIGRSFYEPGEDFAHDPHDAQEFARIARHAGHANLALYYAAHPGIMGSMLSDLSGHFGDYTNQRLLAVGASLGDENAVTGRIALAQSLRKMLYPRDFRLLLYALASMPLLSLAAMLLRRGKGAGLLGLTFLCLSAGALAYLPLRFICTGDAGIDIAKVTLLMLVDMLFIAAVGVGVFCADKLYHYLAGIQPSNAMAAEDSGAGPGRLGAAQTLSRIWTSAASSKKRTVCIVAAVAILMMGCLLFVPPRSGSVNNGDFGRMMSDLGLIWEGDIYDQQEEQAGRQVIETYAFREPFDALKLTFLKPTYSLIFPATIVRLICEGARLPFHTDYLSFVFCAAALACLCSLARDLYGYFGKLTLPLCLVLCAMLLGEIYIVWFNSLFGEGSIYLGVLMLLTVSVRMAMLPRGKGAWWMPLMLFACLFLSTAKAQMLLALPGCLALAAVLGLYHMPEKNIMKVLYCVANALLCALVVISSIAVYRNNDEISAKHTTWQSVFFGVLMIAEDPIKEMQELGIDTAMAPDIGKHAYYPDDEYVYAPLSAQAQQAFYDHVSIFTVMKYYLRHPAKLITMLNHAARESVALHDGFMAYVGQRYDLDHDPVDRFGLWQYARSLFAGRSFWHYAALYGALICLCVRRLCKKDIQAHAKLLTVVFLAIMSIGILQFPLSVIGNGFADNNKQLFCFMLCHDLLIIYGAFEACRSMWRWWQKRNTAAETAVSQQA